MIYRWANARNQKESLFRFAVSIIEVASRTRVYSDRAVLGSCNGDIFLSWESRRSNVKAEALSSDRTPIEMKNPSAEIQFEIESQGQRVRKLKILTNCRTGRTTKLLGQ